MRNKIHPTAIIDDGAEIGTNIWHWAHVCGEAIIGKGVTGKTYLSAIMSRLETGKIQNNVSVHKRLSRRSSFLWSKHGFYKCA